MSIGRRLKRTDLFLLRVWLVDSSDVTGSDVTGSDARTEWHGRVQRVVDGEVHRFDDWAGLVELLTEMLDGIKQEGKEEGPQPVGRGIEGRAGLREMDLRR